MNIYILYAPEDKFFLQQLQNHLAIWQRQKVITTYHEGNILAGSNTQNTIQTQLKAADIVLLLISSDFVANDQQYKYAEQAIELQKRVVPISVRQCLWDGAVWEHLEPLPKQAISLYENQDLAFYEVVTGLQKIINPNYQAFDFKTFQQEQQNNKATTYNQQADKIYNIGHIDKADFS